MTEIFLQSYRSCKFIYPCQRVQYNEGHLYNVGYKEKLIEPTKLLCATINNSHMSSIILNETNLNNILFLINVIQVKGLMLINFSKQFTLLSLWQKIIKSTKTIHKILSNQQQYLTK